MTNLQEYDPYFKPTNIMKGQGIFKLATKDTVDEDQEEDIWKEEPMMYTQWVP